MRNNNYSEDHVLQNQFTAYLLMSIRRRKWKYLSEKESTQNEIPLESQSDYQVNLDLLSGIPVIEQFENEHLVEALLGNSKQSIYIFLERSINKTAFREIADSLGVSYRCVTMSYYRMLKKLKKELDDDDR